MHYGQGQQGGGDTLLEYKNPIIRKDGTTLSIDNIVLDLYLSNRVHRDQLMRLLEQLPIRYEAEVSHWTSFRIGTYREQFSIKLEKGKSFWVGAGLNLAKTKWGAVRLEFNPNKVADIEVFQSVHGYLIRHTRPMHRKIRRYDLAVDIPQERQRVCLIKDARAYYERRHGQEWTQYLGPRSAHGRVKLYNKGLEAKLASPLTRLELTLDPAIPYEEIRFPSVYYLDDMQMRMDELRATDTERFILNAILAGYGTTHQLGRKTRAKIERLMALYVKYVEIDERTYQQILDRLREYTAGEYGGGVYPTAQEREEPAETWSGFQEDTSGMKSPFET